MTTPKLNILLLGPPEVTLEGKPVLIKRRLNRALLFYLAAQRYPVTREELCALFWPEENEQTSRKYLREALSRLRTSIGVPDLLISAGEQVFLSPANVWVDYKEMDVLISPLMSSSEMANSAMLPEWMVAQLKKGMALCRTNRFVQGMIFKGTTGFDNWLELNNQSYRYARIKVVDRLIDHFVSSGNLEEALLWLGQGVEVNPFDEDWNYLTLICLRDTGRLQELISFATYLEGMYQQHEETLPARFAELKKDAIRNKELVTIASADWPEEETGEASFINRENELETLNRVLRRRGVVLLQGEAGIGKTRLLKQFFTTQPYPPRLFYCPAHPLSINVPFYTIAHALRDQIQNAEWQALDVADQDLLTHFYQNMLQGASRIQLPASDDEFLNVLENVFRAFLNLLRITASHRPLLLILDDAKWMDLASVSITSFLVEQKFFDRYGLLILVVSPEVENPHIEKLLQRLRRLRKLETIELSPLADREVGLFMQRLTGRVPAEKMLGEVQRLTGGNPYFLVECLRTMQMLNSDNVNIARSEECSPPETVKALVKEKFNGLEKESVRILNAAAILGRKFCVDVVEEITGVTGDNLVASINELVREGFLQAHAEEETAAGYIFKHDIERQIVVQWLGPAGRRNLHLKAARALEKRRSKNPEYCRDLALHYQYGGEIGLAVRAWLQAGRYARSQYSKEGTYTAYGSALDLITRTPAAFEDQLIYDVVNEWGYYAVEMDDTSTSERVYNDCLQIADTRKSSFLAGTGYNGLGRLFELKNEFVDAEECLRKADFYLSNTNHQVEKNKSLARLGNIHFGKDDYHQAIYYLEKALHTEPDEKDTAWLDNRVNILTYLCAVLSLSGEPERAHSLALEMVRDSMLVPRRSALLQARAVHSITQFFSGRVKEAVKTYIDTQTLADNLGIRYWRSILDLMLAQASLFHGDLDRCWQLLDVVNKREEAFSQEKLAMHAQLIKGDLYRKLGAYDKAKTVFTGLIESGEKNYQTITSLHILGLLQINEGRSNQGNDLVMEAINNALSKGLSGVALEARLTILLSNQAAGKIDRLKSEGQEIVDEMATRGMLNHDFYALWIPATIAEWTGKTREAIEIYNELQQRMSVSNNHWAEMRVLAKLQALSGDDAGLGKRVSVRVDELLAHTARRALRPETKGLFVTYRKKWRKYVNVVSTPMLYTDST